MKIKRKSSEKFKEKPTQTRVGFFIFWVFNCFITFHNSNDNTNNFFKQFIKKFFSSGKIFKRVLTYLSYRGIILVYYGGWDMEVLAIAGLGFLVTVLMSLN